MTVAIVDAVHQLGRHGAIRRVGEPIVDGTSVQIDVDVAVQLPNRARGKGVSATGVRAIETCRLVFGNDWPLSAPEPFLRTDFPLNLPHINPHRAGELVSPCIFEGSLDELLHRFGLDAIIDQLVDWLNKAAAGALLNLEQGWEPTRRDDSLSMVVFSAEKVVRAAPVDGQILSVPAVYVIVNGAFHAVVRNALHAQKELEFSQRSHDGNVGEWHSGTTATFIVRAPMVDGSSPLAEHYHPETVVNRSTLLDRAAELGIDRDHLAQSLDDFYSRSILRAQQDWRAWANGLYAIVILLAQRPVALIGAPGRTVEVLPYIVHFETSGQSGLTESVAVYSAIHADALSSELLARASGLSSATTSHSLVMLGCGSVGSKIAMHLGRAGFGAVTFVDNEYLSPHNAARHALIDSASGLVPPRKSILMKKAFEELSHQPRAFDADVVHVLGDPERFSAIVPQDARLLVDSTASLRVLAAASRPCALDQSLARLVRVVMYGQGRSVAVLLEGQGRVGRVDDLTAFLFERCRSLPEIRAAIAGETSEPTRIFVGDNCSSLTMPMSDVIVSRATSLAGLQLERWLVKGPPQEAMLCTGSSDADGIGMQWSSVSLGPTTVLEVAEDEGWCIRILDPVVRAIDVEARRCGAQETGGALMGRISYENRTITIAGLVDAPSDSVRQRTRFVLGAHGLVASLRAAHASSLGYLTFIGTWHSHPTGGAHSSIDRTTLRQIAKDAGGLPAVSLVWTPTGLSCAVDRQ